VRGAFELDGGTRLRDLTAEEEAVGIAGFGIDENVTTAFDCVLDAAGTANSLRLSCGLVRRLSNHGSAKTQKQEKSNDRFQLEHSSLQDDSKWTLQPAVAREIPHKQNRIEWATID
jgi:hypothetical protein